MFALQGNATRAVRAGPAHCLLPSRALHAAGPWLRFARFSATVDRLLEPTCHGPDERKRYQRRGLSVSFLFLLDPPLANAESRLIGFLRKCVNPSGGLAGSPGFLSHLASCFAAVSDIAILGLEEGFALLDRYF